MKRVMNVAGHGNETRIRSLVIGESEFIFCRCYYDRFSQGMR